jgi:hypothetical protein
MSLLDFTDRNFQFRQFYDPLNERQWRDSDRRGDEIQQLREFGYIKRDKPIPAKPLTPEERTRQDRENRVIIDSIHRRSSKLSWQRGEQRLEEWLVSCGKDVVVPVRCKTCGDPVKDNTRCENCIKEDGP